MKRLIGLLLAFGILLGFSPARAAAAGGQYDDVAEDAWYCEDVRRAGLLGLMEGRGEGRFAPDGLLTLAEAVTLAARVCSLYLRDGEPFEMHGAWYDVYVEYALAHGILQSAQEDFSAAVTRRCCAALFAAAVPAEALAEMNTVESGAIPDVGADEAVYALYRAGVLTGYEDHSFRPDAPIRRCEIAAVANRMLEPDSRLRFTLEKPEETRQAPEPVFVPYVPPMMAAAVSLQPASAFGAFGQTASFTVAATGDGLTYQWQRRLSGGLWTDMAGAGSDTAALTLRITNENAQYEYRCVITDAFGEETVTDTVFLVDRTGLPQGEYAGLRWTLDERRALLLLELDGDAPLPPPEDAAFAAAAFSDASGAPLAAVRTALPEAGAPVVLRIGEGALTGEFGMRLSLLREDESAAAEDGEWQLSVVPPGCTSQGYTMVSGAESTRFTHLTPSPGHSWGVWSTLRESDGVNTGIRERVCERCGASERETVYPATDFPTLRLEGDLTFIGKYTGVPVTAFFEGAGVSFSNWAELKIQGHSTLGYEKKNYTIKFYKDESHSAADKYSFFGSHKESKYILKANWIDPTKCRNLACADLWYEVCMSRDGTKHIKKLHRYGAVDGMPVAVYLNGEFLGLYDMVLHKDDDLYDLDKGQEDALLILNQQKLDEALFRAPAAFTDDSDWELEFCGTEDDTWAKEKLNALIAFVCEASDEDFSNNKLLKRHINIDSAIDYLLTVYALGLTESSARNMVLLSYSNDPWICSMFDMEAAFGLSWDGSALYPASWQLPCCTDGVWDSATGSLLWDRLLQCYESRVRSRYAELREETFTVEHILDAMENRAAEFPEAALEADRALYPGMPSPGRETQEQLRDYLTERLALLDAVLMPATEAGE